MAKPKILLVCEQFQTGEKKQLGDVILEAGAKLGIPATDLKAALTKDCIQEELKDKEWPTTMSTEPPASEVGRILAVGITAYNKIEIFKDKGIQIERIPQPRSWDEKMREDSVTAISRLLSGWIQNAQNSSKTSDTRAVRSQAPLAVNKLEVSSPNSSTTQTPLTPFAPIIPAAAKTEKPNSTPGVPPSVATKLRPVESLPKKTPGFFDPPTDEEKARAAAAKSAAISVASKAPDAADSPSIRSSACPFPEVNGFIPEKTDLEALETLLKVEVANSRMQACIFNWSKDGSTLELRNAGLARQTNLEGLIPILVADDVLKDEDKIKEVRAALDKAGYKSPYLMPVREFMLLVRMYQILAKERKLVLELVV